MEAGAVVDGRLFEGVFEASPDAIIVTNAAGSVVAANSQCLAVFGHLPAALVGQPIEVLVPAAARAGHPARRDGFAQASNQRPMGLLQLSAVRADGSEFPAEISLAQIDVRGERYVCATVRDITDRKRQERRFRDLIDAAPDATVIVDAEGTIVFTNRQVNRVFGYGRHELTGCSVEVLVPERFRGAHHQRRAGFVRTPLVRGMGQGAELYAVRKDGTEFPVEISLSPLDTDEGLLVSAAVRDITERRRIQATADRIREEFMATVSHELRTPLTSIVGYTELLGDLGEGELGKQARRMLEIIDRNARRELRLVNDLLTLAQVHERGIELEQEPVDLAAVARASIEDSRLAARGRGVQVTLEVGEGTVCVLGDAQRLGQVVSNLLTNAVKFTPPGGKVRVELRDTGEQTVELRVADTGAGMDGHELAHVFERLYRAPSAVRDQVPGAGLGLPIAKAVVEAHQGDIEIESEPGRGTTVTVRLAARPDLRPA
ncbi:PAS domain-containing sensor histidine kinase [Nocardioides sp. SYSU DS0663]|uniref:PAS domain-containing sensor histidine kinase n=1 Tax=Nocardioides sp. SYSU DS0663 TaxID=3416445 RepID=UPI003F4C38FA